MWRDHLYKAGILLLLTTFLAGSAGMNLLWHHCNASKKDRLKILVLPASAQESCCGHACSTEATVLPPQGLITKAPCCEEQEYFFKLPEFSSKEIKNLIPGFTATLPGPGDFRISCPGVNYQAPDMLAGLNTDPPGLIHPDRPLYLRISQIRIPLPENKAWQLSA
ncbi:MAG TPA: hypothetical protein P5531_08945 [Bacteroidales bacterium]|nr:hypothetical protein [Bacteroidales bacterium]HSA43784.1 hypothetical protein [Bacteroidales bacterium]